MLVVNADPAVTSMLRSAFDSVADAVLDVTPSAKTAMRLLSVEPYDLVAVDPAISSGGFTLLKYVKDNYRWTETLIATHNQEPQFLREAIGCGVDGLLFRPASSAEFVEQALLLAREASARRRRQQKRVLAIGAHPDDVEIGCGGALAKHYDDYDVLHILTLSRGAAGGDTNVRVAEAHNAAAMVGAQLKLENLRDTGIDTGAETISIIEAAIRELQATHVYTHSNEDTHQDHRAIHAATPGGGARRAQRLLLPVSLLDGGLQAPSLRRHHALHRQEDRPDRSLQESGRPHGVDSARHDPVDSALLGPVCRPRAGRAAGDRSRARQQVGLDPVKDQAGGNLIDRRIATAEGSEA